MSEDDRQVTTNDEVVRLLREILFQQQKIRERAGWLIVFAIAAVALLAYLVFEGVTIAGFSEELL